jgi:hypothetical protein
MLTLDPHLVARAHMDWDLRLGPRLHHGIHAPVGNRRGRRRGEHLHARHGHGSIHGIHARVLMHDEQPRAGLVTRVGRGDDRERCRVDGQLRVGPCEERGRAPW